MILRFLPVLFIITACYLLLSLCRKGGHENQPELGTVSHEPKDRTY